MFKKVWFTKKRFVFFLTLSIVWLLVLFFNLNQLQQSNDLKQTSSRSDLNKTTGLFNLKLTSQVGDLGKAYFLNEKSLTSIEKAKYDEGWHKYEFNQYLSDMISVDRTLPDIRNQMCLSEKWYEPLPQTSVIIIFYNEAFSVLLRTVHSVLNRSKKDLIKEIILVDDFSDYYHLGSNLDEYMQNLSDKIKIIRLKKREGLIRARLYGADAATGDVLLFLDSHCEVFDGWLEPLLDPIARNQNVSTVPIIETIDYINFGVSKSTIDQIQVGGFNWNLIYDWHPIPTNELKRRSSKISPIRSPTMAGGLFAIHKRYFQILGKYDPEFDIWGAENLELSFKIWMCGGELVTAPCSHVGHIFRMKFPYKFPTQIDAPQRNTIRLAEVWLDEYKKFYYERIGKSENNLNVEFGDVEPRKQLRKSLNCKSFDWYLKNIFPEQFIPDQATRHGQITQNGYCIESSNIYQNLNLTRCGTYSTVNSNQFWYLTKYNEIRFDPQCIVYEWETKQLKSTDCIDDRGKFKWIFKNDQIKLFKKNYCIESMSNFNGLFVNECNINNPNQKWQWPKRIKK